MNPFVFTTEEPQRILKMSIARPAAARVKDMFEEMETEFFRGIEERIPFDPGHRLGEDECFEIEDFPVPDELIALCEAPHTAERLTTDLLAGQDSPQIKAIIGYDFSGGVKRLLFQAFDANRVFQPSKAGILKFADGVFKELDSPVVSIDHHLAAVWQDGTLYFRKLGLARRIFDFAPYEIEATEEQIQEFASHSKLACADAAKLTRSASRWARGKIARILQRQTLDQHTILHFQSAAQNVNFVLTVENDRIVLPEKGIELRRVLQFLDDDIFRGAVSDDIFIASGKRAREEGAS